MAPEICWLPERTNSFLKHYHLDKVKSSSMGIFDNYDEFCDELYECYLDTASASIRDEEEGAVLYFILRQNDGGYKSQNSSFKEES